MSFKRWFDARAGAEEKLEPLTEKEAVIMAKIANKVVEWKMTAPAIIFLESVKPLNYIGAQALVFFEPFVQTLFNIAEYDTFREMMERRENVERLLQKIEEVDAAALAREREERRKRRAARGKRRWGFFGRRVNPENPESDSAD